MYDQRIVLGFYFPASLASIGWGMNIADSKPSFGGFLIIAGTFVLVCSLILYFQNKRESYFPEIDITVLKKWSNKWANEFKGIKKITLYDAPNSIGKDYKYVLIFLFKRSDEGQKWQRSFVQYCMLMPQFLFDDNFVEVYKKEPKNNYRDSWFLSTTEPDNLNNKFSIVIYNKW